MFQLNSRRWEQTFRNLINSRRAVLGGKLSRRFKKPDNRSPTMAALAARKPFIQTGTGSLAFDLLIRINATRGVRIIITIS